MHKKLTTHYFAINWAKMWQSPWTHTKY